MVTGNLDSEQVIKGYLHAYQKHEKEHGPFRAYDIGVAAMRQIDLARITKQQVDQVIGEFLLDFGWMDDYLEDPRCDGWQSRLSAQIQADHITLTHLRALELRKADLGGLRGYIEQCYQHFGRKGVFSLNMRGEVPAVKTLHLICPDLFPLWDRAIRKGVTAIVSGKPVDNRDVKPLDYYAFMQAIQGLILRHEKLLFQVGTQYNKRTLKLVDELLWWATQSPFCLFLQEGSTVPAKED